MATTTAALPQTLETADLCQIQNRSDTSIERDLATGRVSQTIRIGRLRRWPRSDIEAQVTPARNERT